MSDTITALITRVPGVKFQANEQGNLIELTRWGRLRYRFDKHYRNRIQVNLNELVNNALANSHYDPKVCTAEAMRRLPISIYDRSKIPEDVLKQIIPGGKTLKKEELTTHNITSNTDIYNRVVVTAKRALALGIKPIKTGSGTNGANFLTDLEDKAIAVFKVKNNPRKAKGSRELRALVLSSKTMGFFSSERECLVETIAPLIAQTLNLSNVPLTGEESFTFS